MPLFEYLRANPSRWLVTGAAGFIGSHLVEQLLKFGQSVIGLDDFSTGYRRNLADVEQVVGAAAAQRLQVVDGTIIDLETCRRACAGIDYVLHHAALGSVPLSIEEPLRTHQVNVLGTLQMLQAAREKKVKRFVFASSSSVYGDQPGTSMTETAVGRPLSPYAASKRGNELDAEVFARCYGMAIVGLRYFNVFGPRQDPNGAYAAVIPRWIRALLMDEPVEIFGDGTTTRDFCFVENVVQANLLAATAELPAQGSAGAVENRILNIACGNSTSLNQLFVQIRDLVAAGTDLGGDATGKKRRGTPVGKWQPIYKDFRTGDVRHSQADIDRARRVLGYEPTHSVADGLAITVEWFRKKHDKG